MNLLAELYLTVVSFDSAHTEVQFGGSVDTVVMLMQFNLLGDILHVKQAKNM